MSEDDFNFLDGSFPKAQILGGPRENLYQPQPQESNNDTTELPPIQLKYSHPLPIQHTHTLHSPHSPHYMSLSCIDIANHLTECPVCSRLHKSSAPVFIGIILFLIIMIFFLGKKVFE